MALICVAPAQAQAKWGNDLARAMEAGRTSGRPVLIDFAAEWCGPCKMLENEVFGTAKVQSLLRRVVCVRVDIDKNPKTAARYQVTSIPRLVLLSSDGRKTLWDAVGFRDADTFAEELADVLGVRVPAGGGAATAEPPSLAKVRQAIKSRAYESFRARDPKSAAQGLALLVERLGISGPGGYDEASALIAESGRFAVPALLDGMGHRLLAVRAGSFQALKKVLGSKTPSSLPFDPWARAAVRKSQLDAWRKRLGSAASA